MKSLLIILSYLLMNYCYSAEGEPSATLKINNDKLLEFGSTYNFKLTIYPFELDLVKKEDIEVEDFVNFLHVAEVKNIERSENNYDAVVIDLMGIITGRYSIERKYSIKIGELYIPLILEIPAHGKVPSDLNEFTILGHEKPKEKTNYLILILSSVIILLSFFIFWIFKKNKKKTLYEDIVVQLATFSEKRQLEYLYERRKEIISVNNDSKTFFKKLEKLQYRKDWLSLDKSDLVKEKNKIIEELNGAR